MPFAESTVPGLTHGTHETVEVVFGEMDWGILNVEDQVPEPEDYYKAGESGVANED